MRKIFYLLSAIILGCVSGMFFCLFLSTSDLKAVDVTADMFLYAQNARNCNSNLGFDAFWITRIKENNDTVYFTFQSPINTRYYGFMGFYFFSGMMTLTESTFDVAVVKKGEKIECIGE